MEENRPAGSKPLSGAISVGGRVAFILPAASCKAPTVVSHVAKARKGNGGSRRKSPRPSCKASKVGARQGRLRLASFSMGPVASMVLWNGILDKQYLYQPRARAMPTRPDLTKPGDWQQWLNLFDKRIVQLQAQNSTN